jgi:hypothetical protein
MESDVDGTTQRVVADDTVFIKRLHKGCDPLQESVPGLDWQALRRRHHQLKLIVAQAMRGATVDALVNRVSPINIGTRTAR